MESQAKNDHLTVDHRVLDIVKHPAFKGFGELMLPWADNTGYYDTRLDRVGSLMPYHSHVDADVVVGALNDLIDEADAGKTIFYEFYTERQKQEDPTKKLTGLFFYRGKPGAPFAIVCPGGGFSYVGSLHEGFPLAREISKKGLNAFVIRYRVDEQMATEDLAAAISYVFRNAEKLGRRHARLLPLGRLRRRPDGGQYRLARRRRLRRRQSPQAGYGRHRLHRTVQLFERFPADIHRGQRGRSDRECLDRGAARPGSEKGRESKSNTTGSRMPVTASAWAWARMQRAGSSTRSDFGSTICPDKEMMCTATTPNRLGKDFGAANIERASDDPPTTHPVTEKPMRLTSTIAALPCWQGQRIPGLRWPERSARSHRSS